MDGAHGKVALMGMHTLIALIPPELITFYESNKDVPQFPPKIGQLPWQDL
jgi:hypothetical protein